MNDLPPAHSDRPGPASPWVFVVDDEPSIGMMLGLLLESQYRTAVFHNPTAALTSFRNADPKPRLLITDFKLPGMTGAELIGQCKALHAPLKTILFSGVVDEALLKSVHPQPDRLVRKALPQPELMEMVKALLAE